MKKSMVLIFPHYFPNTPIIFFESVLFAAFFGIRYESFPVFIFVLIGLYLLVRISLFAWVVTIAFSVGWAVIGMSLGILLGGMYGFQIALAVLFSVIFFIFSFRLHLLGYGMR
jgi:hypothetical protein